MVWKFVGKKKGKNVRIKVDSSVGKLAELSLLLELGGLLGVLGLLSRQCHVLHARETGQSRK